MFRLDYFVIRTQFLQRYVKERLFQSDTFLVHIVINMFFVGFKIVIYHIPPKIFDFAATDLLKVGETVHWGGGALEYMTLDKQVSSKGGGYYTSPPGSSKYGDSAYGNQFSQSDVSREAKDSNKAKRLWELSEKLVGTVA